MGRSFPTPATVAEIPTEDLENHPLQYFRMFHGNQMKDFGQKILMRMMKVHHIVTNRLLKWQGCPNTILKRIAVRSKTIML